MEISTLKVLIRFAIMICCGEHKDNTKWAEKSLLCSLVWEQVCVD